MQVESPASSWEDFLTLNDHLLTSPSATGDEPLRSGAKVAIPLEVAPRPTPVLTRETPTTGATPPLPLQPPSPHREVSDRYARGAQRLREEARQLALDRQRREEKLSQLLFAATTLVNETRADAQRILGAEADSFLSTLQTLGALRDELTPAGHPSSGAVKVHLAIGASCDCVIGEMCDWRFVNR